MICNKHAVVLLFVRGDEGGLRVAADVAATIDKVLGEARITAREVEKVFLTGGTSFVPAVRRLFAERFGNERLMSGDQFESIAYGLALIGHSPDPDRWTVAGGLESRTGA